MPLTYSFLSALGSREDLQKYGDNAILLFALQLRWGIEDIHSIAADSLVDGPDDKSCDLVYVDRDLGIAVIAQGYFSSRPREAAPSKKADDLHSAANWILGHDIDGMPERMRPAAIELQAALRSREIHAMEFWYVHNCPETDNVKKALTPVGVLARDLIAQRLPDSGCEDVRTLEIGCSILEDWYAAGKTPIMVGDSMTIEVLGGYELSAPHWSAFATALPAKWLHELYNAHRDHLFSANVRDYLGSQKRDSNINRGIKDTAEHEPDQFWAFNNGITALVNDFRVSNNNRRITINGISIVNGAQTTAALGLLDNVPADIAMVPARFVKCSDPSLIQEIVKYNNSQNRIEAADFRSTDAIQRRLRAEFEQYAGVVTYRGGRRGWPDDIIRRPQNDIPSGTVAQALTAFHQDPVLAYQHKSRIWEDNADYERVFNQGTHADHLVFVYALYLSVIDMAEDLKHRAPSSLTDTDKQLLAFMRLAGSKFLLVAAIGACMETILQKPIPSLFLLRFRNRPNLADAQTFWAPIIQSCTPFNSRLEPPLRKNLVSPVDVRRVVEEFKSLVGATRLGGNASIYDLFSRHIITDPWPVS